MKRIILLALMATLSLGAGATSFSFFSSKEPPRKTYCKNPQCKCKHCKCKHCVGYCRECMPPKPGPGPDKPQPPKPGYNKPQPPKGPQPGKPQPQPQPQQPNHGGRR